MNCSFKWKEFANTCAAKIKEIAKFTIIAVIGIGILIPIVVGIGYIAVHLFGIVIVIRASSSIEYYEGIGVLIILFLSLMLPLVMGIYEIKQSFTICEEDNDGID